MIQQTGKNRFFFLIFNASAFVVFRKHIKNELFNTCSDNLFLLINFNLIYIRFVDFILVYNL